MVYSALIAILVGGCDGVCPPCTTEESEVLSAVTSGDTLVLAEYLDGSKGYDLHCREHQDPLRDGEWLSSRVLDTKHAAVLRTYLRFPIPANTKNEMLWSIHGRTTPEGLRAIKMLLVSDAHLDHPEHRCHVLWVVDAFERFDSLGYDFNWVSDRTGNNILMDYCSCSEDFQREDLKKVLRYFLDLGVRTDIKNHEGETAFDIANRSGVIEVLREAEQVRP